MHYRRIDPQPSNVGSEVELGAAAISNGKWVCEINEKPADMPKAIPVKIAGEWYWRHQLHHEPKS